MPQIPLIMPQLGESIAEATIVNLFIAPGDLVQADQDVMEVETSKATMTVTAPATGRVAQVLAKLHESHPVGAVLGFVEVTTEEIARVGLDAAPPAPGEAAAPDAPPAAPMRRKVEPTVGGLPVPANAVGASYISPRMKARMTELGLHAGDLAGLAGSGAGGRVTIEDFEKFIASLEAKKLTPASTMRVAVADAMRRSWTRPLATVGLPVPLDALLAHRAASRPKPGITLYAVRALGIALGENSAPGGRLVGNRIVHPSAMDVGFAVEAEEGVLVPVLRHVDRMRLAELLPRYNELMDLARQRRLPADATGGSIATVTNFGTFGLTWATPIPLPEQTLVLGLGAARKVPAWDEAAGRFVPATEAEITLSFDHRVLDGGAAGRLLSRVRELLGRPAVL
jgi:pyruvate/2-oxoglutarate dehydrogenase complex dihydrolipoamide acyltransferase (E2) component